MVNDDLSDVVIPDHPCPPARSTLDEWEREAETLPHMRLKIQEKRFTAARDRWTNRMDRWGGRDLVVTLATQDGLGLDQIASLLAATPEEIAGTLVQPGEDKGNVQRVLNVVRTWKANPDWSAGQIGRHCGVTTAFVTHHVNQLGGTFAAVERRKAGGGHKYPAEVYDTIRDLRAAGMSYTQIEKRVGVHWNTVARICKRRGYGAQP